MDPALQGGDLAVASPTPPHPLSVGAVITSRTRTRDGSPASELIARGRVALQNGSTHAALALADRAIAADPHADDAWLLKGECLPPGAERIASLQAGLTVNPGSARLRAALDAATAGEAA